MGEMSQKTLDLCEQIASMVFVKVPTNEIAEVFGWPEARVLEILEHADFQNLYQNYAKNEISRQRGLASSWDKVEERALKIVSDTLTSVFDPEFALRAAAVANRASRKGLTNTAEPLDIKGGARTSITLNINYTKQIGNNGNGNENEKVLEIEHHDINSDPDKNTDVMPLNKLKDFMNDHSGQLTANDITDADINAASGAID